jgi:hypothetical protein
MHDMTIRYSSCICFGLLIHGYIDNLIVEQAVLVLVYCPCLLFVTKAMYSIHAVLIHIPHILVHLINDI